MLEIHPLFPPLQPGANSQTRYTKRCLAVELTASHVARRIYLKHKHL